MTSRQVSKSGGGAVTTRHPLALRVYVAGVFGVAAAVTAWAVAHDRPVHSGWVTAALLLPFLAGAHLLRVRYHYREHTDELNLVEIVLAPLIFVLSAAEIAALTVLALVAYGVVRRLPLIKSTFNVAQWTLASVLASVVFTRWHDPSSRASGRNLGVLVVAMLVVFVTNQLAISGVFRIASGHASGAANPGVARTVYLSRTVSLMAGIGMGIVMAAAYDAAAWTIVLTLVPVVLLHWASHGHAAVRADRRRLDGLLRASHALTVSLDRQIAFEAFLVEVARAFEVSAAEIVLTEQTPFEVHRCVAEGLYVVERRKHLCAGELLSLREPIRIDDRTALRALHWALEAEGHKTALVAPLRSGERLVGLLFLHDRTGMEGFEQGELAVAAALAAEVVSFLERAELLRTVVEEQRKLADIVDNASDGIFTVDAAGTIRSWNTGIAAMTGYSADETVGRYHVGVLRLRDGDGHDVLLERWSSPDTRLPEDVQALTATGDPVWLSCSYSRVPAADGHPGALVVIARNVTEDRELERLKDDFVAVVSHELRTPLVGIRGFTSTLLSRGDRMSEDQRRQALQAVMRQAQRLEQLVLNILEASRIEARVGGAEATQVDVVDAVTRVVDEVVSARPGRVVRLTTPARDVVVRGSVVWLERALANLVGNAVKYSPEHEPVDVSLAVEDNEAVVRVTDRGPGIPRESRERIFERFERLEDSATQTGTGLGLYITRQLVRAMGGSVVVDSVEGAGSTFTARLPLEPVLDLPTTRTPRVARAT